MRFVIFGGTTEGRTLSLALAGAGAEVTVCVASAYGQEQQGETPGVEILTGPLSADEKAALLKEAVLCIDATHPYATHITQSVREACEASNVRFVRLQREESAAEGALWMESASDAAAYLAQREGNILLTTGAKELPAFSALDPNRLFPRVLPSHESLSACEAAGIPHRNIIAMQGPFSREMNEAILRQFSVSWLVTKDGGEAGGFPEKAEAAGNTGVTMIVLRRPQKDGMTYDSVLSLCLEILHGKMHCFWCSHLRHPSSPGSARCAPLRLPKKRKKTTRPVMHPWTIPAMPTASASQSCWLSASAPASTTAAA